MTEFRGEHDPALGVLGGNALRDLSERIDGRLACLANNYDIDPCLVAGYRASVVDIYKTGNEKIDSLFAASFANHKSETLEKLVSRLAQFPVNFGKTYENGTPEVSSTKPINSSKGWEMGWKTGAHRAWIDDLKFASEYGIIYSEAMCDIIYDNVFNFDTVANPGDPNPIPIIGTIANFNQPLFELYTQIIPDKPADEITAGEIALKLKDLNLINVTKDNLDARVENFRSTLQIELANVILNILVNAQGFGGNREKTIVAFAQKNQINLLADNLDEKLNYLKTLAEQLRKMMRAEQNPNNRNAFYLMSAKALKIAQTAEHYYKTFAEIYDSLGIELPADLVARMQIAEDIPAEIETIATQPEQSDVQPEEVITVEVSEIDQPDQAELAAKQAITERAKEYLIDLQSKLNNFRGNWVLSKTQHKKLGLDTLQLQLINGFVINADNILPSLDKERAQRIIDILAKLEDLVRDGDIKEARDFVERALNQQLALEMYIKGLGEFFDQNEIKGFILPVAYRFSEDMGFIRDNWRTLGEVIKSKWADRKGPIVANRVERFLFGSIEFEGGKDEQIAQPNLEQMIAEQLDEIILPPNASQMQIAQALREMGTKRNQIKGLNWDRLLNLVQIRDEFHGKIYRSKPIEDGSRPHYFVTVIDFEGQTFAIAESIRAGNATYIVSEEHAAGNWLEVLSLSKDEARGAGAVRIVHHEGGRFSDHIERIYEQVLKLYYSV